MKREHINENGEFQSDRFPETPEGCILLKFKDVNAHTALLALADYYEKIDPALSSDVRWAVHQERKKIKEA